jgi:hypothetical protein
MNKSCKGGCLKYGVHTNRTCGSYNVEIAGRYQRWWNETGGDISQGARYGLISQKPKPDLPPRNRELTPDQERELITKTSPKTPWWLAENTDGDVDDVLSPDEQAEIANEVWNESEKPPARRDTRKRDPLRRNEARQRMRESIEAILQDLDRKRDFVRNGAVREKVIRSVLKEALDKNHPVVFKSRRKWAQDSGLNEKTFERHLHAEAEIGEYFREPTEAERARPEYRSKWRAWEDAGKPFAVRVKY